MRRPPMQHRGHDRPCFTFHVEGAETWAVHSVPATVLVQILQSAQQAFDLIGIHVEGRSVRARARVSPLTSERFRLVCQLPVAGSYAMPVVVGAANDLVQDDLAARAMGIFRRLMERVSLRQDDELAHILPDERIRRRVLESMKGMAPRAGAGWSLRVSDDHAGTFAQLDQETLPFLQRTLVPAEQQAIARVVTGELKNIDFIEHRLTILYPPTARALECIYDEELEDLLYERRRDLIQVTGQVVLDDSGQPRQIIDVTDIRDLDLSAFVLDTLECGSIRLQALPELVLAVRTSDDKQLVGVEDDDLGIVAYADTREQLLRELSEQIAVLWHEYALAADDELDAHARRLKQQLLSRFREG